MKAWDWLDARLHSVFEYGLVVAQFYLAFSQAAWAQAYGSTALAGIIQAASSGKPVTLDLMAVATVIGAVFLGPQALLFAAVKAYQEFRAKRPLVVADRRETAA